MEARKNAVKFADMLKRVGYVNKEGKSPTPQELEWLFGQSGEIDEILNSISLVTEENFVTAEELEQFEELKESGLVIEDFGEVEELYGGKLFSRLESEAMSESQRMREQIDGANRELAGLTAEKNVLRSTIESYDAKIALLLQTEKTLKEEFEMARKSYTDMWCSLETESSKYEVLLEEIGNEFSSNSERRGDPTLLANAIGNARGQYPIEELSWRTLSELKDYWGKLSNILRDLQIAGRGEGSRSNLGKDFSFEVERIRGSLGKLMYESCIEKGISLEMNERLLARETALAALEDENTISKEIQRADDDIVVSERRLKDLYEQMADEEVVELNLKHADLTKKAQDTGKKYILRFVELLSKFASFEEIVFAKLLDELNLQKDLAGSMNEVKEILVTAEGMRANIEESTTIKSEEKPSASDLSREKILQTAFEEEVNKASELTKQNRILLTELESMGTSLMHVLDFGERGSSPKPTPSEVSSVVERCRNKSKELMDSLESLLRQYDNLKASYSRNSREEIRDRLFVLFYTNPSGFQSEFEKAKRSLNLLRSSLGEL